MKVWSHHDYLQNEVVIQVELNGKIHTRALRSHDDKDVQDLRIAGMFWKHHDRALETGDKEAALTEGCLAVERLFPHLREELPA